MEIINLKILESPPDLSVKAKLIIEPLAPLSMVSDLPGSFYKSLNKPSKKMLCGLFENLLGWHIDIADRKKIQKDLVTARQKGIKDKEEKKAIKTQVESYQHGSTYIPLLMEYFEIELVTLPPMMHYNDLWSRAYRRSDTIKHLGGTRFMDGFFIKEWDRLKAIIENDPELDSKTKTKKLDQLFKDNILRFAPYYSSPTMREYVDYESIVQINLLIDNRLARALNDIPKLYNCSYLGNSESWVDLKLEYYE